MFKVVAEKDGKTYIREVYAVRINGFSNDTEFLIWWMENWIWVPARLYRPASPQDLYAVDPN